MRQDDGPGVIHQIHFAWNGGNRYGEPGLGPAAWSLYSNDEKRKWDARLSPHARMESLMTKPPPECSFFYMAWPESGEAALLRRVRTPQGTHGQEVAHALIGPNDRLTVDCALDLDLWSGWRSVMPTEAGATLHTTSIERLRAESRQRMPRRVGEEPPWLVGLVSRALRQEEQPLSVFTDDPDPMPGFRMFVDVMQAMYTGLYPPVWTFSTWENQDSGRDLPRVLFLPPSVLGGRSRLRQPVVEGQEVGEDYVRVARRLVQWCGEPASALSARLRDVGVFDADTVAGRVSVLSRALRVGAEPSGQWAVEPGVAPAPRPPSTVTVPAVEWSGASTFPKEGGPWDAPPRPDVSCGAPSSAPETPGAVAGPGAELVRGLRRRSVRRDEALTLLEEMRRNGAAASVDDRRLVRDFLSGERGWAATLTGALRPTPDREPSRLELMSAHETLVRYATAADLGSAHGVPEVARLAERADVGTARALARYAAEREALQPLLPAFGLRWVRDQGVLADDPAPVARRPAPEPPLPRAFAARLLARGVLEPVSLAVGVVFGVVLVLLGVLCGGL
ncbi:hypothetical protein Val02_52190 [Virgisporangium aliadipatigenens]|uniref:Uncharacterized protein n=1 Tax=Virgisporangium aliadipatigenens TaxID=741659 RepID=A0A8J3YQ89_9ACTN|nr:hypothetical protein [Virgisporangium aliadipatigenens]GIJ48333.1 hypothetical protein Val02_52190 [Virgisporangium aliadipatigenens]